jgi:hypothetical protein
MADLKVCATQDLRFRPSWLAFRPAHGTYATGNSARRHADCKAPILAVHAQAISNV